jgi:para-aminobenzoate synthetase component I
VLKTKEYNLNPSALKPNIEALSRKYDKLFFFDSNKDPDSDENSQYEGLLAIGSIRELVIKTNENALDQLQSFYDKKRSWLFGYLSYDMKNSIEDLHSKNQDELKFPLLHFFSPAVVIELQKKKHTLHFDDEFIQPEEAEEIYRFAFTIPTSMETASPGLNIQNRISKEEYFQAFEKIKQHILRGDIYEINFCQEFFAENAIINPALVFDKLNKAAKAPFSAFFRLNDHFLLSSSPERFLKKQGNKIISQPIKGTIRRSGNKAEDDELKLKLRNDTKEQNENVMIVDLVRNDLSRIAEKGSVRVDELFGIYTFLQVHQMISTVSCTLKEDADLSTILRATFPMGSMTGAPKVKAMQLIEEFEKTMRGLYSGAIGYIDPEGNFDFSVVIRSILYNSSEHYLSFTAGSAITSKAEAEQEYQECLLKAKAMFEALS